MPLQKNLNVKPYYADYNPASDYYKVLFKAGYPVQARELTDLQLMMQNQIETFMSRFLKEGDTVVPGEFSYAESAYVRVSSITQGATAQDFVGYTLTGAVSGVQAFVNLATAETAEDDVTFYVNYLSSGTTAEQKTFIEGETLESNSPSRFTAVVGVNTISKPTSSSPMGQGSLFNVKEGYYFIDGTAVRTSEQTITLDKYSTKPSYSVGFLVTEEFITSSEDPALLDNSQGSTNFAAPGADRLKIGLNLIKRGLDATNPNFLQLAVVVQGNLQGDPDQKQKWAWLYDILAKRTFDESGDYIVTEFPIELLQYANTDLVDGLYNADANGLYPAVPGSESTTLLTAEEADAKFAIKISPGEAYVQGYEVGFRNPIYLYADKPRTQNFRTDTNTQITNGYNVSITNLNGTPDFANIDAQVDTIGLETIRLYRNFSDGYVGEGIQVDANGFVEPFNIGNAPPITYHVLTEKGTTIDPITVENDGYAELYRGGNSCVVTGSSAPQRGGTIGGETIVYVEQVNPTPSGLIIPRYLMPAGLIEDPSDNPGTLGYNSTYDLGIVAAEYFIELFLLDDNSTNFDNDWVVGDQVVGEQTGSVGVVEEGSIPRRLIVSNITGEFAPGENVIQGDKISKIALEGEIASFAFTDLGTSGTASDLNTETSIIVRALGSEKELTKDVDYVYESNNTLVPTSAGRSALRNFPYPEGSVLSTRINYTLETKPNGIKGYATQTLGKIQNSVAKTKSFYSPQPNQATNFTADISAQTGNDSEIVPIANRAMFSGAIGNNFLESDNFTGDPADELEVGDIVTFVDDTGRSIQKLVTFATRPVGYGRERDSAKIYFTTTLTAAVSGKIVQRIRIKKKGAASETLIYQLPQTTVASLQNDPDATGINYSVMSEFVVELQAGTDQLTLNTNKQNETFISNLAQTTITVAQLPSDPSDSQGILGRQLSIDSAGVVLEDNGRQIKFTLDKTLGSTSVLKVLVPVYVTNAKARIKTLNKEQSMMIPVEQSARQVISMGITDLYRIRSITMAPNGLDVFENYIIDNGQRDNVYQIARLIRKPGIPAPTGELTIIYDYFTHSGEGDFFSVDSYTSDGGLGYSEVPVFFPNKLVFDGSQFTGNIAIQLRDCVDFRPVVNTSGATPTILPVITPTRDATTSTNFLDSGTYDGNGIVPRFPVRGSLFICDMAYYMARIDSLFLENTGALRLIQGVSANNPTPPADLATGIRLYDIELPPYTFTMRGVTTVKYNYARYTMQDIAGLDAKISRLEDLVTLSILEQSALNMQVRDAVTGLNRFKNGIVVDAFQNHAQGAVGQEQYRNSMDPVFSHLRAAHYTDQIELIEDDQTPIERKGNGYKKSGPLLTMDYESIRFMQNPFATRSINLQPYSVFTYDGNLVLTPSVDTFQDITKLPDLVVEDNNLYDAMVNLTGTMAESGIGTVWGDWENTGKVKTKISNRTKIKGDKQAIADAAAALQILGVDIGVQGNAQARMDKGKSAPIRAFDLTTSVKQKRQQTKTTINVSTGSVKRTSYGERVVDVQLARTMRTVPVRVQAGRLKPNTRYYFFFDEVDCSDWFSVDTIQNDYPDGLGRYTGDPGTSQRGFGAPILSDDIGNVSGIFLIPNGRPPVVGSIFTNINTVEYQTSGETRSFNTGTRRVKITSSPENARDLEVVEGFAEATFVASGVLLDKQETIVATRIPEFGFTTEVVATERRWQETTERKANYFDPVAQTFLIDNFSPEGLFVTELDVFFKTKDNVEGVEAYLTTTDGQVPTEQVMPLSRVVKNSDTTLRVIVTLGAGQSAATLAAGTIITGQTSGSTGLIKSTQNFESAGTNTTTNVNNTTYNVILSNYVGEFIEGEEFVPAVTPAETATFTIVTDTFEVEDVRLTQLGSGYTNPTVTFSTPELPGGVAATGIAKFGSSTGGTDISGNAGIIYEIEVTSKGSGYTQTPSITISDPTGSGASGDVLVNDGTKAIDMGVCTSTDATAATKFKFPAPVYLLGNTNYSFVLKAPTSLNYNVYTSKLGEDELGTDTRVTIQPNLGSLFKSQNGGLWTEDQTQDIKFVLYRAEFIASANAEVVFNNAPMRSIKMPNNPIETSSEAGESSSTLFGNNPKIVRVIHDYHGLVPNDLVSLSGIIGNPGGIPNAELNTVHNVIDADITYFTIKVPTSATNSERSGGNSALISPNRPYEVLNVYTGAMQFGSSTLRATNRATQAASVTGFNYLKQYSMDTPNNIVLMDSYYYNGPKLVANQMNEAKYRGAQYLRNQKSMEIRCTLATVNSKVSPVIDIDRTNAVVVRNLIDNPKADAAAQGVRTATMELTKPTSGLSLPAGTSIGFTKGSDTFSVKVKSYNENTGRITVQGDYVSNLVGATYTNTTLQTAGVVNVTYTNGRLFEPETSPDGSVYAKWISRDFLFENPCDGIEVKLAACYYDKTSIRVYYRPRPIGFEGDITQENWTPFNPGQLLNVTDTSGTITPTLYPGLPDDVNNITVRDRLDVDPRDINPEGWRNLSFTVQDIAAFDSLQIKIVMSQDNPALAPLIDDMQLVCTE